VVQKRADEQSGQSTCVILALSFCIPSLLYWLLTCLLLQACDVQKALGLVSGFGAGLVTNSSYLVC